ncbi:M48 family peptidase [Nitrospira tepida]|uniref:M48 family peptidase n=1 Tax=Nitrospira tepida TaxID=2973512 RepID=A0AA86N0V4_9BACT|nr:M48 family metallopeptidase [Nitrospira tepida]CAI4032510.1 M48 family peptidase [Nitrospira tepida]
METGNRLDTWLATPLDRRALLALLGRAGVVCAAGFALGGLQSCYKAPGTARDQFIFISEEKEIAMGTAAFRDVLRGAPLSPSVEKNELIHRVGERIAKAANKPEYHWEFAVIQEDRIVNAFALPGGKVAVFTGLLKYTQNEAGLATVMGHEVAHALQRHGAERMSRGVLEQIAALGTIAAAATGAVPPGAMIGLQSAYGVGVSLPFNRKQESEADYIGLRLMAQAGYDPREALPFWERMSGCPRNMIGKLCFRSAAAIPEFLSTHPSDVTRMNQIEAWLPDALRHYRPDGSPPVPSEPIQLPPIINSPPMLG